MTTGTNAAANFSLNTTSGIICFSSLSQDCRLINLTHYNFSISDNTGNLVFTNQESVPESTCAYIGRPFQPQCSPFHVYSQPINNNIEYEPISKKVYVTGQLSNVNRLLCMTENDSYIQIPLALLVAHAATIILLQHSQYPKSWPSKIN